MPIEKVEFNPDWYRRFIQATNEKKLLVATLSNLIKEKPNRTCLDLGLGIAPLFAQSLAHKFENYVLVEREVVNSVQLPKNVKLINQDWEEVKLDEKFDVILASHIYYYFRDKMKAVDKMFDYLNRGGREYFVVNGKEPDYGPLKLAFSQMIGQSYIFTYDELNKTLENRETKEYSLSSFLAFSDYEQLYETMRISFDNYPEEYEANREKIVDYLKENVKNGKFCIVQKIIEVQTKV